MRRLIVGGAPGEPLVDGEPACRAAGFTAGRRPGMDLINSTRSAHS